MNNNTETIRDAARKEICIMFGGREITPEINSIISQYCNGALFGANWQKEQDEAKYKELEKENRQLRKMNNIAIDKYKELLDSHNELLQILEKAITWVDDDFNKGLFLESINKAKNI